MIFPRIGSGTFTAESFEDDGETEAYRMGGYGGWRITVESHTKSVSVRIQRFGAFTGLDPEPRVIFPESETRAVSILRS
jgi:alpha-glucosidase